MDSVVLRLLLALSWTHPQQIFPQVDRVALRIAQARRATGRIMSVYAKKTKALDLCVTPQHISLLEEVFFNADILGSIVEHLYSPDATRVRSPSLSSFSKTF